VALRTIEAMRRSTTRTSLRTSMPRPRGSSRAHPSPRNLIAERVAEAAGGQREGLTELWAVTPYPPIRTSPTAALLARLTDLHRCVATGASSIKRPVFYAFGRSSTKPNRRIEISASRRSPPAAKHPQTPV
jgi:hypothetical protein